MSAHLSEQLNGKIESFRTPARSKGLELEVNIPASLEMRIEPDLVLNIMDTLLRLIIQHGCQGRAVISAQSPFGKLSIDIIVHCTEPAPTADTLEEDISLIRPLMQQLKVSLKVANPTPQTLLFHVAL